MGAFGEIRPVAIDKSWTADERHGVSLQLEAEGWAV